MKEECKDCRFVEYVEKRMDDLENVEKDQGKRIAQLERSRDVGKERMDIMFNMLDEVKKSIDKVNDKIVEIESRPNKLMWAVLATVVGSIILTGLSLLGR